MNLRALLFPVLLLALAAPVVAQTNNTAALARGKYLVEQAGQCQDCHSQRNAQGEFIRESWLMGGPILFKPTVPIPQWSAVAMPIAGLPGWQEQDAIRFLMTGKNAEGKMARPPMPQYRFNRADATAIVKYLKSLDTSSAKAAPAR